MHFHLHCKTTSAVLRLYYRSVKESLCELTGTCFEKNETEIYCYQKMNTVLTAGCIAGRSIHRPVLEFKLNPAGKNIIPDIRSISIQ
jgi:hypothetical protein